MWSPNELLKIEKQRDILSYITLQFFHFKKVPLEHCPFWRRHFLVHDGSFRKLGNCDFYRGVWYFAPIGGDTSFMGFIRDDVTKAWLIIPF